jgi:hypothetical protein
MATVLATPLPAAASLAFHTTVSIETVTVDSWDRAQQLLYDGSWSEPLGRHRSSLCFRGRGCLDGSLRHGLQRTGSSAGCLEPHLLRSFRKYAHQALAANHDSPWHWLALAQHHGLPTRLLDWSYSPLVALHFATADAAAWNVDGAVWCVDYVAAKRVLPAGLGGVLETDGADVFTPELLARAVEGLQDLETMAAAPYLIFLEPPSLDDRIINQYALFSLLSSPDADMSAWLAAHAGLGRLVVIDRRAKPEIRDKLDQANVTERVLFPGLDGLCRWLRRYYEDRRQSRSTSATGADADASGVDAEASSARTTRGSGPRS